MVTVYVVVTAAFVLLEAVKATLSVTPLSHEYDTPPEPERVTSSPLQTV